MESPFNRPVEGGARPIELRIPFSTIAKLLATVLVVAVLVVLRSLEMLLFLSVLIAVTLNPAVDWLEAKGGKRWQGVALAALLMTGVLALVGGILIPSVVGQVGELAKDLPRLQQEALSQLPHDRLLTPTIERVLSNPGVSVSKVLPQYLLSAGGIVIGGASFLALLLILSLYLVLDGRKAYRWVLGFFGAETRGKLDRTAEGVAKVIAAYVAGQLITSLLVVIYAYAVLRLLKVPAALSLACLAGIFDVLPIVGFFLATIPAFLLGVTVSLGVGLAVVGAYLFYHLVENYAIVPKVYGNRLRLSTLAVLLSLLAGAELAGIVGAIAILPIIASYPVIEKIWLGRFLGQQTLRKHEEIASGQDEKAKG